MLGLALTSRDKGENAVPMAGFPHHQLESYLGKLVSLGQRVAICEQMEDPRQAKGIVKREVTRVVTPGTLTDDALLDPRVSNYLAAIVSEGGQNQRTDFCTLTPARSRRKREDKSDSLGWSFLPGAFLRRCFPPQNSADQLARIEPAECLIEEEFAVISQCLLIRQNSKLLLTRRPAWAFSLDTATQALSKHFGTATLEGFGFEPERDSLAIRAAGAIVGLSQRNAKSVAGTSRSITSVSHRHDAGNRRIDSPQSGNHAHVAEGRREGSLLAVLDRTVTAMGSRLLADWLANPLMDIVSDQRAARCGGRTGCR